VEIDLTIRDPDDAPVVSAAISGAAEAIVTGDKDLLDDEDVISWLKERTGEVVTTTELLKRIG
jgi:predicted nucleic acid-binding protein